MYRRTTHGITITMINKDFLNFCAKDSFKCHVPTDTIIKIIDVQ